MTFWFNIFPVWTQTDWTTNFRNFLINLKPYQLVIYTNKTDDGIYKPMFNAVFEKSLKLVPSIVVDLSKVKIENKSDHSSTKKSCDSSGLIIYLQPENDANNSQLINFMDFYVQKCPKNPRPMTLLLIKVP